MEWISVKDRLPEIPEGKHGMSVLVAEFDPVFEEIHPGGGYDVCRVAWDGKNFLTHYVNADGFGWHFAPINYDVTHWMPLPDPPNTY